MSLVARRRALLHRPLRRPPVSHPEQGRHGRHERVVQPGTGHFSALGTTSTRIAVSAVLLLSAMLVGGRYSPSASAICFAVKLEVVGRTNPGSTVSLRGEVDRPCNDTGVPRPSDVPITRSFPAQVFLIPESEALTGVRRPFRRIGFVHFRDRELRDRIRLPDHLRPGRYELAVQHGGSVYIVVPAPMSR